MDYIGEHLLPGKLGHFFILLSFVSSLGAAFAYFMSVQADRSMSPGDTKAGGFSPAANWKKLARIFFITEIISVFAIFAILFYIISNHYFEYKYVWQHSSKTLEPKYLLSCFWEGQEGSFLLWSVWHCVLGAIFMLREKVWEAPVMAVISFVQVILATMLLGDVMGIHIGSNPFTLMRNVGLLDNAPAFHENFDVNQPLLRDYLSKIADGNGLNVLLQNYWMVIHPPVLFLGFAATIIPFAFAIGGLWTRRYKEWIKPALSWSLFAAGILGLGIMMGGAWAYESLNFGGYWAWDPVENASLVPWLVLVAGIHTLLIFRHTGNALRTTHLFFILSFALILYSTYLTRSGDLQDTSVHAFTGEGITVWHLRIFLLLISIPALMLFALRYKSVPAIIKEEETSSREFWMFIGSLVFFLSALLIIGMTSIPVINKIIGLFSGTETTFKPLAVGEDTAYAYNRIQIFVAIIIAVLSGFGMYLKYKSTAKVFLRKLMLPLLIGVVAGALVVIFGDIDYRDNGAGYMAAIWIAVCASVFSVIANGAYIFTGQKGKMMKAGGAIGHFGFAMMLLGILISSSKKEVLSYNTSGIFVPLGENRVVGKPGENLTLVKGVKMDMGTYWVTYERDSLDPVRDDKWYYHLRYERKKDNEVFYLTPNAFIGKGDMGLSANPDARHYLTHDVFTYITSLPNKEKTKDTANFNENLVAKGDTIFYSRGYIVFDSVLVNPVIAKYQFSASDTALAAALTVHSREGTSFQSRPVFQIKDDKAVIHIDSVFSQNLAIAFTGLDDKKIKLQVKESNAIMDFITIKAYKFPYINLLWLGTILMVTGFFISAINRREKKRQARIESRENVKLADRVA